MEFYAQIEDGRLKPLYDSDYDELKKLKGGTEYKFTVTQPRNYLFHKKFFGLLNLGFNNQERYSNFEDYRYVTIMRAGFFTVIVTDKGKIYKPKSISFASMDELQFNEVYNAVLDVIASEIGSDRADIIDQLLNFM